MLMLTTFICSEPAERYDFAPPLANNHITIDIYRIYVAMQVVYDHCPCLFLYTHSALPYSTKPTEKPKELIIPLIQKNRWHRPDRACQNEAKVGKSEETTQDNDSVESQAVKELIEGGLLYTPIRHNIMTPDR